MPSPASAWWAATWSSIPASAHAASRARAFRSASVCRPYGWTASPSGGRRHRTCTVATRQGGRAVIFDMDGVLCRYDLENRLAALAGLSGRSPEDVKQSIWGSGFEEDADSGRYADGAAYLKAFGERLGHAISAAEWIAARRASMTPDPEVL